MKHFFAFFLLSLALGACSKQASTSSDDTDDSSNTELASSISQIGDAAFGGNSARVAAEEAADNIRGACSALTFGSCTSGKRTKSFSADGGDSDACTRGKSNAFSVFGQAVLTFSRTSTCLISATGDTVTRTFNNHYIKRGTGGRSVLIYTGTGTVGGKTIAAADLNDYSGTERSGGAVLTKGSGASGTLAITGIHRRGVNPNGKYGFWHTVYTDSANPLSFSTDLSTGSITMNGTTYVAHNRAKVKIGTTLLDVRFEAACRHPVGGSTKFEYTGTNGALVSLTLTWSATCGQASDGTVTVDIEDNNS